MNTQTILAPYNYLNTPERQLFVYTIIDIISQHFKVPKQQLTAIKEALNMMYICVFR